MLCSRFGPRRFRVVFRFCGCRCIHAVEVAFEGIYVIRPELPEWSQPVIQLLKWFRLQAVKAALSVHGGFDETGFAQHAQVLGHRRLRHTKPTLDLSY